MPAPARKPGPASVITRILLVQYVLQHRCGRVRPSSRAHDAGLSPCARNTIREAISRDTSSSQHAGHAARRKTARAAQLAPSAVTASAVGGSATRSVVADSLRRRAAPLRRAIARAPRRAAVSLSLSLTRIINQGVVEGDNDSCHKCALFSLHTLCSGDGVTRSRKK